MERERCGEFQMFKIVSICKGGGYRYCRTMPLHPKANAKGLYPLHRALMEKKLRRFLKDGEIVHHLDGNKSNDALSNLQVMPSRDHSRLHRRDGFVWYACNRCSRKRITTRYDLRTRLRRNKLGAFCSRRCAAITSNNFSGVEKR